jgi:DNA repair exonuclease SbcCD ATPase subunit
MKITKLYLKNFSRVKSALGVDEVTIDLTSAQSLFLFLKGGNGSGKSTLLNQMHPWRDSYDGNGSQTYDEAVKEVTIHHENGEYLIRHQYGKVSKTFVYKNGDLLNSNGNTRAAEDLINNELGYTPEFLELSRISSSMSGFLDKKSTERKKFITSLMPSIDFYINAFDKVKARILEENKKLRSIEAEIAKLDSFSEEDLTLQKENVTKTNKSIEELSNKIAVANAKLDEMQKNLKELVFVSDLDINKQSEKINSFGESLVKFIDVYGKKSIALAKEELDLVKETLIKTRVNITNLESKLKSTNEKIGSINNSIAEDETFLSKLSSVDIKSIEDSISKYENIINSIDVEDTYYKYVLNKEVTTTELMGLENFIQYTVNTKSILGKLYKEISSIGIINIQNKETELKNKLIPLGTEIKALEKSINEDSLHYNEFMKSQHGNKKHCDDPNCPYEKEVQEYEKLGSVIEQNNLKLRDLNKQLEDLKDEISDVSLTKSKAEEWLTLKRKYSTNTFEIFTKHYDFYESDDLISDYKKFYSDITNAIEDSSLLITSTKSLADAKKSLDESKDRISLVDNINTKIANQKEELETLKGDVITLKFDIEQDKTKETETEKAVQMYNDFIAAKEGLKLAIEEKTKMEEDQKKWNDISEEIKRMGDEISEMRTRKSKEESDLSTYSNNVKQLERLKINKEILDGNLETIRNNLNTYSPINNALDPKKGIPVVFQRVYLKQTAFLVNKLLRVAYGEKFEISFELTDNDFFIRVVDSEGNVRDDARSLSDGEKSVVGLSLSLALIEQTGNRDKILYLDEADGVLDSKNRRSFINILENQLVLLGIEQCIIISHNDSFKDTEADVILLKDEDADESHIEQTKAFLENKKVIFDYKKLLE